MYRYTFTSRVALAAAFFVSVSLLLQPIAPVYGQETEPSAEEELVTEVPETTALETVEAEITLEPEEQNEDSSREESLDEEVDATVGLSNLEESLEDTAEVADLGAVIQLEPESAEVIATTTTAETVEDELTDGAGASSTEAEISLDDVDGSTASSTESDSESSSSGGGGNNGGDDASDQDSDASDTASSTEQVGPSTTDESQSNDADTEELGIDKVTATTTASTTDETGPLVTTSQSDRQLAFTTDECTQVAGGSFYCQKTTDDQMAHDDLFAAPDSTGDMEIYVIQDGEQQQVTSNNFEDASPYYDARSETLVWHRLVNDRYQIISYDIDSGEEEQLTDTRVNNMEPARSGDYTVWQRWVTNNWEIILFDGVTEIELTDSIEHDIAPNIHGELIIWNVRANDGRQSLMTYDIQTGMYQEINDTDGVSVANPRMLVMYEAQYQNGDTVMKGFDIVTGEIVPIEHLPRELPPTIPEPDSTGEVRALPNNPVLEEEIDPETEPEPESNQPNSTIAANETSTTSVSTLDLRPAEPEHVTTTTDQVVEQATIPDVVVTPFVATTTADTASSTQEQENS